MGGIKDMLSPPCQNMGGIYHPHPPQDLRPCPRRPDSGYRGYPVHTDSEHAALGTAGHQ